MAKDPEQVKRYLWYWIPDDQEPRRSDLWIHEPEAADMDDPISNPTPPCPKKGRSLPGSRMTQNHYQGNSHANPGPQ